MDSLNLKQLAGFVRKTRRSLRKQILTYYENSWQCSESPDRLNEKIEASTQFWFFWFCFLRILDVNHLTEPRIVSLSQENEHEKFLKKRPGRPSRDFFYAPDILKQLEENGFYPDWISDSVRREADRLLSDENRKHSEMMRRREKIFQLLLKDTIKHYHRIFPVPVPVPGSDSEWDTFLFSAGLLKSSSILLRICDTLNQETCQHAELLGWLYQFYLQKRREKVITLSRGTQKFRPEDIPVATQLFTPDWIVRYLVENSLGRLWITGHPESGLRCRLNFLVACDRTHKVPKISSPEEIRICDSSCGTGHLLQMTFEYLVEIYQEAGYKTEKIPALILQKNLFGLEIDECAAALAKLTLMLKATFYDSGFLEHPVEPQIGVLRIPCRNIEQTLNNLNVIEDEKAFSTIIKLFSWNNIVSGFKVKYGTEKSTVRFILKNLWTLFADAENTGSLIRPERWFQKEFASLRSGKRVTSGTGKLNARFFYDLRNIMHRIVPEIVDTSFDKMLKNTWILTQKYHVVLGNPPYMGHRNMNSGLRAFAAENYSLTKADLFMMFLERNLELTIRDGFCAMITMQSWMFLSSFETFRKYLLKRKRLLSLLHLGSGIFEGITGEVVMVAAFVFQNQSPVHQEKTNQCPIFLQLTNYPGKKNVTDLIHLPPSLRFEHFRQSDFLNLPGAQLIYQANQHIKQLFEETPPLGNVANICQGLATSNNRHFLRYWFEVSLNQINFRHLSYDWTCSLPLEFSAEKKGGRKEKKADWKKSRKENSLSRTANVEWVPYNKGGTFRKWFGNQELVVDWTNDGEAIRGKRGSVVRNMDCYFKESLTWSSVGTGKFCVRYTPPGFIFDVGGSSVFTNVELLYLIAGFLCSGVASSLMNFMNPTVNYQVGNVSR
ncbi:MAG: BREX-1 system adenine-specific DNA-methyltransferase PglX, partial [Thermoguttaceae bacterium]|nr:BREX-1 system adenine-specific DNA-methyltransferase PglX [Thermoguttaceae bacterium]